MTPSPTDTPAALKVFWISGEHVQAWCTAPTLTEAELLLGQNLDELELSSADVNELPKEDWDHFGIPQMLANASDLTPGEARMLHIDRGCFH